MESIVHFYTVHFDTVHVCQVALQVAAGLSQPIIAFHMCVQCQAKVPVVRNVYRISLTMRAMEK